jgi:hypothetical protein
MVSTCTRLSNFSPNLSIARGSGRPAQLAVGIGQGGLDGMQAVKPFAAAFTCWRLFRPTVRLFRGFPAGLG